VSGAARTARLAVALGVGALGAGAVYSGCGGGGDDYVPVQRTTIKWELNQDVDRGFAGDACVDLGVQMMRVVLTGPTDPPTQTVDERCAMDQVVFTEQPPGSYTVALTPLDGGGQSMVTAPITRAFEVTGTGEIIVNVPWDAWNRPFTGSFLFHLTWAGQPCTTALPPVVDQVLTLVKGGTPVTQMTATGQRLDGTDPQPCIPSTNPSPQLVSAVPIGPATFTVEGHDSTGTAMYEETFETFVGAGTGNPTITFDVGGPPDAPPPDAALPDAALPDAAPPPDA
jgi:hypothetical protein